MFLAMPANLICPNLRCRKMLIVPDEMRGKVVKCSNCDTMLKVPPGKPDAKQPGAKTPATH